MTGYFYIGIAEGRPVTWLENIDNVNVKQIRTKLWGVRVQTPRGVVRCILSRLAKNIDIPPNSVSQSRNWDLYLVCAVGPRRRRIARRAFRLFKRFALSPLNENAQGRKRLNGPVSPTQFKASVLSNQELHDELFPVNAVGWVLYGDDAQIELQEDYDPSDQDVNDDVEDPE